MREFRSEDKYSCLAINPRLEEWGEAINDVVVRAGKVMRETTFSIERLDVDCCLERPAVCLIGRVDEFEEDVWTLAVLSGSFRCEGCWDRGTYSVVSDWHFELMFNVIVKK